MPCRKGAIQMPAWMDMIETSTGAPSLAVAPTMKRFAAYIGGCAQLQGDTATRGAHACTCLRSRSGHAGNECAGACSRAAASEAIYPGYLEAHLAPTVLYTFDAQRTDDCCMSPVLSCLGSRAHDHPRPWLIKKPTSLRNDMKSIISEFKKSARLRALEGCDSQEAHGNAQRDGPLEACHTRQPKLEQRDHSLARDIVITDLQAQIDRSIQHLGCDSTASS